MQLSKQDEGEEAEVRKEDQERINRFSTLHRKVAPIELTAGKKEKEDLEEISMELELADEDDKIS